MAPRKGLLPKAYLRLDPNVDQTHPDNLADFIRLLCAANRQPNRGVFARREVLVTIFGPRAVKVFEARGDVRETPEKTVIVPGWDDWQEGDLTVAERMQRLREAHAQGVTQPSHERNEAVTAPSLPRNSSVTAPSLDRNSPSDASRRLGVKASFSEEDRSPEASRGEGDDGSSSAEPKEREDVQALLDRGWKHVTLKQRKALLEISERHDVTGPAWAARIIREAPDANEALTAVLAADQRWQAERRAQVDADEAAWAETKRAEASGADEIAAMLGLAQ